VSLLYDSEFFATLSGLIGSESSMKKTLTIPETFVGVGYTKHQDGLPLGAVCVPVPKPDADGGLIRVAASSLNPVEFKLADLNFLGRTPPVLLGFDLSGIVVATGSAVRDVAVGDAVVALADLTGDGGWVAGGAGEGGYALATRSAYRATSPNPRSSTTRRKPSSLNEE
jgi:NADPH:quinone reductase-like Zn-dependent oxidoreductase